VRTPGKEAPPVPHRRIVGRGMRRPHPPSECAFPIDALFAVRRAAPVLARGRAFDPQDLSRRCR
jgi:hypothetical protein